MPNTPTNLQEPVATSGIKNSDGNCIWTEQPADRAFCSTKLKVKLLYSKTRYSENVNEFIVILPLEPATCKPVVIVSIGYD